MITVFLSYAHAEKDKMQNLKSGIETICELRKIEIEILYDDKSIVGGREWQPEIEKLIERSSMVIVLFTSSAFDSEYIKKEIEHAKKNGKVVIPILFESDKKIPEYVKSIHTIFSDKYNEPKIMWNYLIDIITSSPDDTPRSTHNLYVASLNYRGGKSTTIATIRGLISENFDTLGYFKPFHRRNDNLSDVTFFHKLFMMDKSSLPSEMLSPFEYGIKPLDCKIEDIKREFAKISNNRHPIIIEGSLHHIPRGISLRTLVEDIFDAKLLVVIDDSQLARQDKPIIDEIDNLIEMFEGSEKGFIFNRVSSSGKLSDYGREIQSYATTNNAFYDIGSILEDERLQGVPLYTIVQRCNGKILTKSQSDQTLIWQKGYAQFEPSDIRKIYENIPVKNRVVINGAKGADNTGINMMLTRLGCNLFLVDPEEGGDKNIDPSIISIADEKSKTIAYFTSTTDDLTDRIIHLIKSNEESFWCEDKVEFLNNTRISKKHLHNMIKRDISI